MDRVTLKHYQDRADKAQAIVDRIDEIVTEIAGAKNADYFLVAHRRPWPNFTIGHEKPGQYPDDGRTRTLALLANVFIELSLDEIRRLEAELAAI